MRFYRELSLALLASLLLASCAGTDSGVVYTPNQTGSGAPENTPTERAAVDNSENQNQQIASEEMARQAEQKRLAAEAARQAEQARLAQQARERERREAEQAARQEAERQRALAARRAEEQVRMVAAQQARIDALRAQIEANDAETEKLETANALLREAVSAAESLTDALVNEEEKYNNTDPDTGEPLEGLAKARLETLADEVELLGDQLDALMAQP